MTARRPLCFILDADGNPESIGEVPAGDSLEAPLVYTTPTQPTGTVSEDLANCEFVQNAVDGPVVTVSATSITFGLTARGAYHRFTNAAASTCTVPANASVAFPLGTVINLRRAGAANLTVFASGGVTVNLPYGGTSVLATGMTASLKKVGTNEWDLIGQTVPA